MTTQCTPGFWFIKKARKLSHIHGGNVNCSELVVAGVENDANARLISAAPELLEACHAAFDSGFLPAEACEIVREAIAKATQP